MSSICSFLAILCVISYLHGSVVNSTTCNERTELTSAQIQAALDAHNLQRSQVDPNAADMRKLVWSDEMASKAQTYTSLCSGLPPTSQCDPNGETGHILHFLNDTLTVSPTDISSMVRNKFNTRHDCVEHEDGNEWSKDNRWCRDYKQLVWASTSEVGCGIKRCNPDSPYPYVFFVCYYNPGGNIWGQETYRRGSPCSECHKQGPGPWRCENNLCVVQ